MPWDGAKSEFCPEELRLFDVAFADAWRLYNLTHRASDPEATRNALARAIVDEARHGEDEPIFLARTALGRIVAAEAMGMRHACRC